MGMFDWVQFDARLPVAREGELRQACNPFQSKSLLMWEEPEYEQRAFNDGCVTVTVSEGGQMLDPNGRPLPWTGELNFYGDGVRVKWAEFNADFKDGKLNGVSIVEIPDRYKRRRK